MNTKNIVIGIGLVGACLLSYVFMQRDQGPTTKNGEKPIVIVIPSYNNKTWYKKNLDSALTQNYGNYRIIYTDDVSSDGTGALVKEYIKEKNAEKKVTLIQNKERVGALANLYAMITGLSKNEIVVSMDGDDWFPDREVLSHINKVYADPNVWMTYGQFITYPANTLGFAAQFPQDVINNNTFRSNGGYVTHLRTFYAGLFQKIKKEDLFYEGKFYPVAWDTAILMPMLEMSGNHSKFIPKVLYVYNWSNPLNDDKIHRALQLKLDHQIRAKKKYQPIAEL